MSDLDSVVDFSVTVNADLARTLESELRQALEELWLQREITIT